MMTLRPLLLAATAFHLIIASPLTQGADGPVAPAAAASTPSPEAVLQKGFTSLMAFLQQNRPTSELGIFLEQEIAPHFDFDYMAQTVAGPYWRQMNGEQQKLFTAKFRQTFFEALTQRMGNLGRPQVQFYPPRPSARANEVVVSARVAQPQGVDALIDFRFYRGKEGWKVFDVMANGSSALLFYRSQLAEQVQRRGLAGLMQ